jgi:hypothetical protein
MPLSLRAPRRKSIYDSREEGHDDQRSSDKFRFEPVATDRTNEKIGISTLLVVGRSCFFLQECRCCAGSRQVNSIEDHDMAAHHVFPTMPGKCSSTNQVFSIGRGSIVASAERNRHDRHTKP